MGAVKTRHNESSAPVLKANQDVPAALATRPEDTTYESTLCCMAKLSIGSPNARHDESRLPTRPGYVCRTELSRGHSL